MTSSLRLKALYYCFTFWMRPGPGRSAEKPGSGLSGDSDWCLPPARPAVRSSIKRHPDAIPDERSCDHAPTEQLPAPGEKAGGVVEARHKTIEVEAQPRVECDEQWVRAACKAPG